MKTTREEIEKALHKYRIQYQKAKEDYLNYIDPDDDLLIEESKTITFTAKILEQKSRNISNLISICNDFLQKMDEEKNDH